MEVIEILRQVSKQVFDVSALDNKLPKTLQECQLPIHKIEEC